jgi:ABC-2 type transport system ATP-binding protein
MKQRLCLAKTLLHDPKLLLLDEPASGLDPRARIELKELLKELSNMGKTILISSHILPELADFCNKVGIIEKGNLLLNGGMDEILAQINGGKCNMVRFADGEDLGKAMAIILEIEGVAKADEYDGQLQITFDHAQVAPYQLLNALVFAGCRVESFTESKLDLEDLFMSVTKGLVQ